MTGLRQHGFGVLTALLFLPIMQKSDFARHGDYEGCDGKLGGWRPASLCGVPSGFNTAYIEYVTNPEGPEPERREITLNL